MNVTDILQLNENLIQTTIKLGDEEIKSKGSHDKGRKISSRNYLKHYWELSGFTTAGKHQTSQFLTKVASEKIILFIKLQKKDIEEEVEKEKDINSPRYKAFKEILSSFEKMKPKIEAYENEDKAAKNLGANKKNDEKLNKTEFENFASTLNTKMSTPKEDLRKVKIPLPNNFWERLSIINNSNKGSEEKKIAAKSMKKEIRVAINSTNIRSLIKSDVRYKNKLIEVKKTDSKFKGTKISFAEVWAVKQVTKTKKGEVIKKENIPLKKMSAGGSNSKEDIIKIYEKYVLPLMKKELNKILNKLERVKPFLMIGNTRNNAVIYKPEQYTLSVENTKESKNYTQRKSFDGFYRIAIVANINSGETPTEVMKSLKTNDNLREYFGESTEYILSDFSKELLNG